MNGGPWQPISEGTGDAAWAGQRLWRNRWWLPHLADDHARRRLTIGTNTLTFRFNGTDGRVSGFRVLAFNVQDEYGNSLIPSSQFVNVDPNTWQPPSTNPSDISAGERLYRSASLTVPTALVRPDPSPLHGLSCARRPRPEILQLLESFDSDAFDIPWAQPAARKSDCQLHSFLECTQSRTAMESAVSAWARAGLAAVSNWSAGAGLGAVLPSDRAMLSNMFPNGTANNPGFLFDRCDLNAREQQIALMLPDWNAWLPGTHPMTRGRISRVLDLRLPTRRFGQR